MIKLDTAITAYLEISYQKIRLLKDTAKSQVWLAADRTGQTVILKRLASTGLPLKALQEADCPLCPKILCYAEDKDSTLLVEEHIAGDSLQHLAAQGKLTEKEATELLLTVASGLALLHAHGIVHRDIKPANLLLEKSGGYRLIDFDSARLMKDDADEDTALLGTKGYAPPEQYGYGQTDGRSDIYSLGMTIRRLLPEGYRGFLAPIIRKCTAVDPEARYQSATELAQALKRRLFFHKARLPLLTALALALLLLLALSYPRQVPVRQEPAAEPPALTEPQAPPAPASDTKETAQSPAQASSADLPLAPEKAPASAPADTPLPATAEIPASADPAEMPAGAPAPAAPAPSVPTGILRTTLFWNGQTLDTTAYPPPEISPNEWLTGSAFLHVENDSNTALPPSTVTFAYANNYGKQLNTETLLPALSPGETTDIPIPCGTAFPEGTEGLALWVQIRLPKTILPQTEDYQCLRLDIAQTK